MRGYRPPAVNCKYGAPHGRSNILPLEGKVHLQRVQMIGYGDYDTGGVYWGQDPRKVLYCAHNDTGEVYLRAASRDEAKRLLRDTYAVVFYR